MLVGSITLTWFAPPVVGETPTYSRLSPALYLMMLTLTLLPMLTGAAVVPFNMPSICVVVPPRVRK